MCHCAWKDKGAVSRLDAVPRTASRGFALRRDPCFYFFSQSHSLYLRSTWLGTMADKKNNPMRELVVRCAGGCRIKVRRGAMEAGSGGGLEMDTLRLSFKRVTAWRMLNEKT